MSDVRTVYCVMGQRSLPYATACLASLIRNAQEPLALTVVTDDAGAVDAIAAALAGVDPDRASRWRVVGKAELDALAEDRLAAFPAVRRFRNGHPCWRKITDPPLLAAAGEEMIVIDPDVYFPNRFRFEPTPADGGILLMWQRPNCLLPEDVVEEAFDKGVEMADHTDIGVAQLRSLDWAHLEALLVRIGDERLPVRSMHVESIVWAALAMHQGGGHLDPVAWRCFANSVAVRVGRKLGRSGVDVLRGLDIGRMKCLHAGGVAKTWLVDAETAGLFGDRSALDAATPVKPYRRFTRGKFDRKFRIRRLAARLGLYRLLAS